MTAKQFLSQYIALDKEIDSLLEDILVLRSKSQQAGASVIDGTAKTAKSDNSASFERIADQIADIDAKVNKKIDDMLEIRKSVEQAIEGVEDDTLRTLLRYKYLCGHTWEQIAVKMDYTFRHTTRLHGQALQQIKYKGD